MAGEPDTSAQTSANAGLAARLCRIWQHSRVDESALARLFDTAAFERIEATIDAGENGHRGEIRFALEAHLGPLAIWRGQTPRQRALEVFAQEGIWDTEGNTGVLVYLLWADHAVEIIADRAAHPALPESGWTALCRQLALACAAGTPIDGTVAVIDAIHRALDQALPADSRPDHDELLNRPIRL